MYGDGGASDIQRVREEPLLTHENTSSISLQCQTVSKSDRVSSEERPRARGYRKISAGGLDERDVRIEPILRQKLRGGSGRADST